MYKSYIINKYILCKEEMIEKTVAQGFEPLRQTFLHI